MSGWQPIETAPKNRRVLVARPGEEPVIAENVMYTSAGYSWCSGYQEMRIRPTHWMPLPPPPDGT